jgi:hypothetical protein
MSLLHRLSVSIPKFCLDKKGLHLQYTSTNLALRVGTEARKMSLIRGTYSAQIPAFEG